MEELNGSFLKRCYFPAQIEEEDKDYVEILLDARCSGLIDGERANDLLFHLCSITFKFYSVFILMPVFCQREVFWTGHLLKFKQ